MSSSIVLPRTRAAWPLLAGALLLLPPRADAGAQQTAPPANDASSAPAAGAASTVSPVRLALDAVGQDTRIRLRMSELPLTPGARGPQRVLVGTLVRVDSLPSPSYVVRLHTGAEWSVPRSAVLAADRHVGTRSAWHGVRKSMIGGALIGSVTAFAMAQANGSGDRKWAERFLTHMSAGAAVGLVVGRNLAREQWEALAIP